MKRDFLNVQFILLLSFLLYYCISMSFNIPNMGIILGICSLYGYRLYLNSKHISPLPTSIEKEDLLKQIETLQLNKEVIALQTDLLRLSELKKGSNNGRDKKFVF